MINISTGIPSKQINKNIGGKNNTINNINTKNLNAFIGPQKNVFKPTINISDLFGNGSSSSIGSPSSTGSTPNINVGAPSTINVNGPSTINIGDISKLGSNNSANTSNTNGSPQQSSSGKSPDINIIINLLCSCLNGKGQSTNTGSTTKSTTPARTIRRPRRKPQSPLLKNLSPADRKLARGLDLKAKGPDGKPKYLIGTGKDGKDRLYQQKEPGKYRPVGSAPDGSRKLKPKNITTDQHGVSKAGSGSKTNSPLILDTNKDGKVSAQHGIGVDVNGDGRADGAAVGGDKMLTMGDRNGNGKIDGTEVFGNKTVDPFTNKAVNARNGFEALKKVALSAQQATGQKVIDANGKVNVQKLSQALKSAGKGELGMISGNNTTRPEALGDVASINTQGYKEQAATGNVQHRQLGSYTDTQGAQHKVNDVWFKNA